MKQSHDISSTEPQKDADLQVMRISRYHSIIISKNVGSILLIVYIATAILCNYDSIPAFYILAANNFLPFLFALFIDHNLSANRSKHRAQKKEVKENILPLFSKKYHYTYVKYQGNSISFMFVFLLIALWQKRELNKIASFPLISFIPLAILFVMFMLRVCGNVYFRKKFDLMLLDSSF